MSSDVAASAVDSEETIHVKYFCIDVIENRKCCVHLKHMNLF